MRIRFQADANLDPDICRALCRREPSIDFESHVGVIADSTPDSEVLTLAAESGRVLVPIAIFDHRGTPLGLVELDSGAVEESDAVAASHERMTAAECLKANAWRNLHCGSKNLARRVNQTRGQFVFPPNAAKNCGLAGTLPISHVCEGRNRSHHH